MCSCIIPTSMRIHIHKCSGHDVAWLMVKRARYAQNMSALFCPGCRGQMCCAMQVTTAFRCFPEACWILLRCLVCQILPSSWKKPPGCSLGLNQMPSE